MGERSRILVADDHPLYRAALAELFQRHAEFELIAAVADLPAALAAVNQNPCDLAILDIRMPGMDGLAGVAALRAQHPGTKVALISGEIDERTVAAGIKAGVTGFLPKSFDQDVILAAVKLILSGGTYVPYGVPAGDGRVAVNGDGTSLTSRELEILSLMAGGAAHKEIGRALGIAEVTVKLHTQRIVRKLGVKNRSAAIAKAVKDHLIELPT